jgi:hypothetical protein
VTDWTLISTTLGTASITGLLGYVVAKRNGDVALRGVEAENGRLREQHREDHFRHRQGSYHDFLNAERAVRFRFATSGTGRPAEEFIPLFGKLDDTYNGVILFGSPSVIETSEVLLDCYQQVSRMMDDEFGDAPDALSRALAQMSEPLEDARRELVIAMRDDVGYRPPTPTAPDEPPGR